MPITRVAVALAGAAACACGASGVTTVYYGEDLGAGSFGAMVNSQVAQASFLSNLIGVGVENFEGLSNGSDWTQSVTGTVLDFGVAGMATMTGGGLIVDTALGPTGPGRFPTSGNVYIDTDTSFTGFEITFSQAIAAFGFYGTDFGDFSGQIIVELTNGSTQSFDVGTSGAPNGSGLFWGVITTELFTKASFVSTSGDDAFGFDDMIIGSLQQVKVIPLPAGGAMACVGLFGVMGMRRRR